MDRDALVEMLATAAPKDQRALRGLIGLVTDHAAKLAPAVIERCEAAAGGTFLLPRDERLVDAGLHVLAAAGRSEALPALLALLRAPPVIVERLLGDETVAVSARLVVSLFDGNAEPLLALAADPEASGEGRWSVLLALAWLVRAERTAAAPVADLLRRIDAERLAADGDPAWLGWRDAVAYLGLADLAPRMAALSADGRLPPERPEQVADFVRLLEWSSAHPHDLAPLERDGVYLVRNLPQVLDWLIAKPRRARKADRNDAAAGIALDADERAWLAGFLVSPQAPEGTFDLEMLDGYFAALVAGPELILPSEYLPVLWGGASPEFASMAQAEHVTQLLMRHWNAVAARLHAGTPHVPELFPGTLEQTGRRWAEGFLVGLDLRRDAWRPLFEDEEHATAVLAIMALIQDDYGGDEGLDEEARAEVIEALGRLVLLIALYWRERRAAPRRRPVKVVKVGRNDPCPCGSGRKHKRCCGAS